MFTIICAIAVAVVFFLIVSQQSKRLADPKDQTVVYLDDLAPLVMLEMGGAFVLNTYRQSGNPYSDGKVYETPDAALAAALATFRRAKIDEVAIRLNTANRLDVSRAFFDHRGRAEGKKVGAFEIIRVV